MKLVMTADTHNAVIRNVPDGDVFIHAGDLAESKARRDIRPWDLIRILNWISLLPHKHKVVIAGNHDFFAEANPDVMLDLCEARGITYLQDSGTEIGGKKFWGSPITPTFSRWAFMLDRGADIEAVWHKIPDDTDVLITHGPPHGVLDLVGRGEMVGCAALYDRVMDIRPMVHVFGHIHEGYGHTERHTRSERGTIQFYNVSHMDEGYRPVNPPVTLDI